MGNGDEFQDTSCFAGLRSHEVRPPRKGKLAYGFIAAITLHIVVLAVLGFALRKKPTTQMTSPAVVAVHLTPPTARPARVQRPAPTTEAAQAVQAAETNLVDGGLSRPVEQSLKDTQAVPQPPDPVTDPVTAPPPETYIPPPILNSQAGSTAGGFSSQNLQEDNPSNYAPSRWALEPPLASKRLEGLGLLGEAECLRSLSPDCKAIRQAVFEDYALTDTQKVWTAARADTAMPSQFYGLSEREIRLKVGSKIAGENGFMILPGIGIDGELWDRLHGIKKGCQMKRGILPNGSFDVVGVCPESLPAARDRKYVIPPKPKP